MEKKKKKRIARKPLVTYWGQYESVSGSARITFANSKLTGIE